MQGKEYKELSCRYVGIDCDFLVRAETEDEVMRLASEHAREVHKICEITPEFRDKMTHSIRHIWCGGEQCGYAPKGIELPYWG